MSHVTVLCAGRRIGPLMRARSGTSFSSCRCPSSRGGPAMRAAVVTRFGGPEVFELAELPDPVPGPGQVAIDVTYAAVGLVDIYIRQGLYKDRPGLPQPPYVPGLEVAGTVRALGDGVAGFEVGELVVTLSANSGTGGVCRDLRQRRGARRIDEGGQPGPRAGPDRTHARRRAGPGARGPGRPGCRLPWYRPSARRVPGRRYRPRQRPGRCTADKTPL